MSSCINLGFDMRSLGFQLKIPHSLQLHCEARLEMMGQLLLRKMALSLKWELSEIPIMEARAG